MLSKLEKTYVFWYFLAIFHTNIHFFTLLRVKFAIYLNFRPVDVLNDARIVIYGHFYPI